ncbi:hypothetical protein ACNKHS_13155 [Shigella flexneri]
MPRNALYATTVIAGLGFLTSTFGNQTVYLWLLNTSRMTGWLPGWVLPLPLPFPSRVRMAGDNEFLPTIQVSSHSAIFAFHSDLIITPGQMYEAFLRHH